MYKTIYVAAQSTLIATVATPKALTQPPSPEPLELAFYPPAAPGGWTEPGPLTAADGTCNSQPQSPCPEPLPHPQPDGASCAIETPLWV